jgi:hypothetical protein
LTTARHAENIATFESVNNLVDCRAGCLKTLTGLNPAIILTAARLAHMNNGYRKKARQLANTRTPRLAEFIAAHASRNNLDACLVGSLILLRASTRVIFLTAAWFADFIAVVSNRNILDAWLRLLTPARVLIFLTIASPQREACGVYCGNRFPQ